MTDRDWLLDPQCFAIPSTPAPLSASASSLSTPTLRARWTPSEVSSAAKSLVEDARYRQRHLDENSISLLSRRLPLLDHIARLVERIQRDRSSSTPSTYLAVSNDERLPDLADGAGEPDVEEYWKSVLFVPPAPDDLLARSINKPMS